MKRICVDASLVIKWLVWEEDSEEALRLLEFFEKKNYWLIAPTLLDYEIGTTIRKKIVQKKIDHSDQYPILDKYYKLDIMLLHITNMNKKARGIAESIYQPTIYDISYLLVAEQQKVDFVTADHKFVKAAQGLYPCVKYYRELL